MELHNSNESAITAAQRWKYQYREKMDKPISCRETPQEIYDKLVNLGPKTTPEQINSVIGNNYWTTEACGECGHRVDKWVSITYDSNSIELCLSCCLRAVKLLEG